MFSVKPIYLPFITTADENDVIQNPSAFLNTNAYHNRNEHSSFLWCQTKVSYSAEQLVRKLVMSIVS
jgi:hypothetical protein